MKRLILMLLLVTTMVMAGFDKEEFDETQFHSGVKLGLTAANITGSDAKSALFNYDFNLGFEIGAFTIYHINNQMTLTPEILFTQKGYTMSLKGNSSDINYTLNYIQIPVLLGFKTAPGLKLYAGGYISYFTNAWVSSSDATSSQESDMEKDTEKNMTDFDMGLVVGATFKGNDNLIFDFRYERGFTTLDKNGNEDLFNHSFNLSVGWLY